MDVEALILNAKIGSERKAAQVETCGPFAAALYDVLCELGLTPTIKTAAFHYLGSRAEWYHAVVELDGQLFDSKGEFSHDIARKRLKLHPKVETRLDLKRDDRGSCYEEELDVLHQFLVNELRKSARKQIGLEAKKAA
ncbi:MAG: hypothetical protein DI537_10410 [Stutzerimonas stutzeri]|nr:MAG: hypothetical protein DI537_10410 [Stutzerimonas stutzeri]